MKIQFLHYDLHSFKYTFVDGPDFYHGKRTDLGSTLPSELIGSLSRVGLDTRRKTEVHINSQFPSDSRKLLENLFSGTKVLIVLDR